MTRSFSGTRSVTQVELATGLQAAAVRYWARPGEGAIDPRRPTAALELGLRSG
jgi:hypothetical protein